MMKKYITPLVKRVEIIKEPLLAGSLRSGNEYNSQDASYSKQHSFFLDNEEEE